MQALTRRQAQYLLENIHKFPAAEQEAILQMVDELERRQRSDKCARDLLSFCQHMDPNYKIGRHHRRLANLLMDMAKGRKDRISVNMPPRMGKSHLVSTMFPAWFLGNYPDKEIMMISHTADLAVDFGRKVRNLIASDAYREVFPTVALAKDSKSAGRWNTNQGGGYYATGVGSGLAGRGADLLVCARGDARIPTARGWVPAEEVTIDDQLWTHKGFLPPSAITPTTHSEEVVVDGQALSADHPVWTFDRGWVVADLLTTHDLLYTLSLYDYGRVFYGTSKHYARSLAVKGLQYLGYDAPAVHQSAGRQLRNVWRAGHTLLRSLGEVCQFLPGYGRTPQREAFPGPQRPRRALHPRELPLGHRRRAAEQPHQHSQDTSLWRGAVASPVGAQNRVVSGSDTPPHLPDGYDTRAGDDRQKNELGAAPRTPDECGWLRRTVFRLYSQCCESERGVARILVGGFEALFSSTVSGVLLGIRRPRTVIRRQAPETARYYDFTVPGANTFFVGSFMTHNCDDPHNEQDILNGNFEAFERAYEWFTFGARTRLMPGGRIALVATRWHESDLTGRLVKDMAQNEGGDQYEIFEFPAIIEAKDKETGKVVEKSLWPEFFPLKELKRTRASMPLFQWNAQYQQNPTGKSGAIIRREMWKRWKEEDPPKVEYIIMALDAAAESHNRADFTAITTWGVFHNEEADAHHLILLNAVKERLEFPELKELAVRQYEQWEPDSFIVEKKSSGVPLYQELRRTGVIVQEFTPHRGTGDKTARLNAVADILRSGLVWAPETRWAEEVIEEAAAFPFGAHDDLVDCLSMALARFRQGGFIALPSDYKDPLTPFKPRRKRYY